MAGFERPQSWPKTWLFAAVAAAVRQMGGAFVIEPLASHIWHTPEHVSSVLKSSALDWRHALLSFFIVWSFAAFGEETGYRGYLLTRSADVGGRSRLTEPPRRRDTRMARILPHVPAPGAFFGRL